MYPATKDTAEIKAMGRAFGKVSPARGGRFFAWVLDGATPDERAAVTRDVPGPLMAIIGGVSGRGYRTNIAPVWRRRIPRKGEDIAHRACLAGQMDEMRV